MPRAIEMEELLARADWGLPIEVELRDAEQKPLTVRTLTLGPGEQARLELTLGR